MKKGFFIISFLLLSLVSFGQRVKTINYGDGGQYVGQVKARLRTGQGMMTYANGITYTGEWMNDLPNGNGEKYYPKVGKFVGSFVDGVPQSPGDFYFDDGAKYSGEFIVTSEEKLLFHGQGVLTNPDRYNHKYDVFKQPEKQSIAEKYFGVGGKQYVALKYEGEFKNNLFHGHGAAIFFRFNL